MSPPPLTASTPTPGQLTHGARNTGHEFVGRSVGYGSLSVWTHFLKHFEFLPEYTQGEYTGMAARVGSGLESWELYEHMDENEMTLVCPGRYTVGVYGGWIQGGGHSALASLYGMGSDQVLSLEVVTADGRFVTADTEENSDLFYALRGGGPSKCPSPPTPLFCPRVKDQAPGRRY